MLFIGFLFLAACGTDKSLEATITAVDGKDGHSIVSSYQSASELECEGASGNRLDLYLDLDDSLSVSEGDLYSNSIISCNGVNGQKGEQGIPGVQGVQGEPGQQGPQGLQGLVGPQGATGLQGAVGPQGATGQQGNQGLPGPIGPQGPTGPQGLQGPVGSSGATITNYGSNSCTRITGTNSYVKPTGSNNLGLYTSSNCASNTKFAEVSQGEAYWVSANSLATHISGCLRVITFN